MTNIVPNREGEMAKSIVMGLFWITIWCALVGIYTPLLFVVLVVGSIWGLHSRLVAPSVGLISRRQSGQQD